MRFGEDAKHQGMLIADAKAVIDPLQISLDRTGLNAKPPGDRLLLLMPQDQFDDLAFPRSEVEL
jgi:hypothetical protein